MAIIFKILCGILAAIGLLFGLDYKEISIIVCIYCVPCICILCALLSLYHWRHISHVKNRLLFSLNLSLLFCYTSLTTTFFARYDTFGNAFENCQNDIMRIAHIANITYEACNIYIYCVIFGLIIFFHLIQLTLKNNANTKQQLAANHNTPRHT